MRCSSYLTNLFTRLDDVINWNVEQLLPHVSEFDAIAFRGMSGAMVAPAVAARLGKPFILVRKPDDSSHSEYRVEGAISSRRYVIVDDLIATGKTVKTIQQEIAHASHGASVCVVIILWSDHSVIWRAEVEESRGWSARYFENFSFPAPPAELMSGDCVALEKTATQVLQEREAIRFTAPSNEAVEWYRSRIGSGVDQAVWNQQSSLAQSFAQFPPEQPDYGDAKALGTWKEITGQELIK